MSGKLSKLKKIYNNMDITTELSNPDCWASFGNARLNELATGSFRRGLPNRRLVMLYGPSGTGKSLLIGNATKDIQDLGYPIIYIDTEDAADDKFLTRLGLNITDPEKFLPVKCYTIEQVASVVSEIFREFSPDEKIAIIVDSLGMLETEDHYETYEKKGELKNDMGLLAKKTKKLLKNINSKVGNRDCFFLVNQHSYKNQDVTDGRGVNVVSGGEAQIYIPSITLMLKKLNLKDGKDITGVRITAEAKKTRFTKLGGKVEMSVPWETGIDFYDGLIERMEEVHPRLSKNGAWYTYITTDGEEVKFQKKDAAPYLETMIDEVDVDTIEENLDEDFPVDVDNQKVQKSKKK